MPATAPEPAPAAAPTVLTAEIAALGSDLRESRYVTEHLEEVLGAVASAALRREDPAPARRRLAGSTDPAATLLALFVLGETLPAALVAAALPTLGLEGAQRLGLLAPADHPAGDRPTADGHDGHTADGPAADAPSVRALVDLAPYAAEDDAGPVRWWIASDLSELATGAPLSPEHVLGVGGASLTLARITPRTPVGRVLDLGCGGGIQAMHASRHAEHVVATDLSERALAFAAFNAALNGIELDLRRGSLLEPVAGEVFDLVVSNPPFVITPRAGDDEHDPWTYRDGGRAGDTLLAELLAQLPAHLAPGASAVMLGNWEITEEADGFAHPRAWLEPALADGVDAWVLQRDREDPAEYAGTWARDGGITPRDHRWDALIDAWLDDFASRAVEGIGFGYLLLRRPDAGRRGLLRTELATGTGSGTLSEHLAASLAALDRLSALDDEALAATRPVRAEDVVERRHLTPGQWDPLLIELVQGAGLARTVPADQALAATVGALDGTLTLGQVIAAVCALTDADVEETRARVLPAVRELALTGMVAL
ncbi:methyltransferase [Brachybacterium paraconglomeratum]